MNEEQLTGGWRNRAPVIVEGHLPVPGDPGPAWAARQEGAWAPGQMRTTAPMVAGFELLSERERELLAIYPAHGRYAAMCAALGMSRHTLKNHVSSLLKKLGLASLGQAAVLFDRYDRGLSWPDVDRRHGDRRQGDRRAP